MSPNPPELVLRYMALADLSQVMTIDRLAFDIPWSERSYQYEITESQHSYMVVLELRHSRPLSLWRRWFSAGWADDDHRIVGFGGLWNVASEAHISTIAVHPSARGRGWGEILLAGMIRRSIALQASEVALEVRVSNKRAQNLYQKYAFQTVGVKAHYYRNNDEDAYDMRLPIEDAVVQKVMEDRYRMLQARHRFADSYTHQAPHHG